jgi:hypothetical protein
MIFQVLAQILANAKRTARSFADYRWHDPLFLAQEGQQQVPGFDRLVIEIPGDTLCCQNSFLRFFCELI